MIIILVAGPDIIAGMELMAFANLLGFDFFVLVYVSGVLLYLEPLQRCVPGIRERGFAARGLPLLSDCRLILASRGMDYVRLGACSLATVAGLYWMVDSYRPLA